MSAPDQTTAFRLLMPKQFTKATKLCAHCGARVQWDEAKRCLVCPRCKKEY